MESMVCLKTLPFVHRPSISLKSLLSSFSSPRLFSPPSLPLLRHRSLASAAAATMAPPVSTVEHFVLFKVGESTDPSKADAMVSTLRSLSSLDMVSYLTAVPVLRRRSAAAEAFGFTHLLHSRYASKPDLTAYAVHPLHVAAVNDFVRPICEDVLAFDWVADLEAPAASPPPGAAVRLTLAKPKEGATEAAAAEIAAAVEEIKSSSPGITQLSFGENFSPARAKGFELGLLAVFPGVEELDAVDRSGDLFDKHKEKVKPLLECVIVLDFVLPTSPAASL